MGGKMFRLRGIFLCIYFFSFPLVRDHMYTQLLASLVRIKKKISKMLPSSSRIYTSFVSIRLSDVLQPRQHCVGRQGIDQLNNLSAISTPNTTRITDNGRDKPSQRPYKPISNISACHNPYFPFPSNSNGNLIHIYDHDTSNDDTKHSRTACFYLTRNHKIKQTNRELTKLHHPHLLHDL